MSETSCRRSWFRVTPTLFQWIKLKLALDKRSAFVWFITGPKNRRSQQICPKYTTYNLVVSITSAVISANLAQVVPQIHISARVGTAAIDVDGGRFQLLECTAGMCVCVCAHPFRCTRMGGVTEARGEREKLAGSQSSPIQCHFFCYHLRTTCCGQRQPNKLIFGHLPFHIYNGESYDML